MKILRTFILLLAGCLPLSSCLTDEEEAEGDDIVKAGDLLPAFSVRSDSGEEISPGILSGRPAVIVFFSTTCSDCRRELPVVQRVYEETKTTAAFICIGREEAAEDVAAFWQDNGLTLPYSPQPDRSVYNLFARRTIPRAYVADATGRVRQVFVEEIPGTALLEAIRAAAENGSQP